MASRSLGTLTLDLIAKTGSFEQGMDKAARKSSRASKQIATDAEKAAARAKAAYSALAIAAIGALGGISIGATFKTVIDNTKQMEQEQAQLAAVLKSTGEAAGYSRDQLNGMAEALAGKSIFSTNEINQAQTALLAFTGVMGGEFVRAQQAAADMAARTGMSIQSATELIGRALDVPSAGMAALSRQGFRFSDDQKKLMVQLESTGKAAEAQGIILEALEESYGGAAQAARDTFGGALDAVRNTINDMLTGEEGSMEDARLAIEGLNAALSSPEAQQAFSSLVGSMVKGAGLIVKAVTAIPWEHAATGASALAAIIATRLTVSVGASAISMGAATVQAARYQMALAAMAGVSTRAAAGITAVGIAARAASGAMALLGGPAGLAILAGSALAYFAITAGDSKDEAEGLSDQVDLLNQSFDGFTKNQAAAALIKIREQLVKAQISALDVGTAVQYYTDLLKNYPDDRRAAEWNQKLILAKGAADDAAIAVSNLGGKVEELNAILGQTDAASGINAVSKEYAALAARLDEQILLIGKKTDSEKLAARIGAGLVEGLKKGEGEALVAKQKVIDAAKEAETAEQRRASAAKSAASAAASAAKAVIERAKSEAKAIQDSVDALMRKELQLGWTSSAIALYDLTSKGATETQLALAKAALEATDAFAEQEKINAEAKGVIESLRTEEEAIRESYDRRKELILETTLATAEEKAELLRRLEEETNEKLLEAGDDYWAKYLAAAEKSLSSFDELAGSVIENFSSQFGNAFESMIFDADDLGDSVSKMAQGMARSVVNALGQMAAQWLAYQVVQMVVGKTTQASAATTLAANASATSLQAGLAAFASTAAIPIVGPFLAPAAMGAALAVTGPLAAAVGLTAMAGMAHDGIDAVPQTGTWLLEKGERVTTSETSAKLDATLARIDADRSGSSPTINIIENRDRAGETERRTGPNSEEIIDIFVADLYGGGKSSQAFTASFGLNRVGQ